MGMAWVPGLWMPTTTVSVITAAWAVWAAWRAVSGAARADGGTGNEAGQEGGVTRLLLEIHLVGKFSLLRIRRTDSSCKACALCAKPCPMKLPVATADTISSNCIGCLVCVDACPCPSALEVRLAPTWLDGIKARLPQQSTEVSHAR